MKNVEGHQILHWKRFLQPELNLIDSFTIYSRNTVFIEAGLLLRHFINLNLNDFRLTVSRWHFNKGGQFYIGFGLFLYFFIGYFYIFYIGFGVFLRTALAKVSIFHWDNQNNVFYGPLSFHYQTRKNVTRFASKKNVHHRQQLLRSRVFISDEVWHSAGSYEPWNAQ